MSLQGEAGVGATGAGGVIVDHARVIRTVHQLTRPADYLGRGGDDESDRRNGAVTCPHEGVAGLSSLGKDVIDQAGLCRRAWARIGPAESGQLRRVAQVGIGDGKGNGGGVDHAEGGNCGGLIGAKAGPEKIGDGNCRDDQQHTDDDEQLD